MLGAGSALAAALIVTAPATAAAWENDLGEVTLSESGGLSERTLEVLDTLAGVFGVQPTVMQSGTIRMLGVDRGDRVVQEFAPGFGVPMSFVAVDPVTAEPLIGAATVAALETGVVMSSATAELRGAAVGDVITLEGWNGTIRRVPVTQIVDDRAIAWNELLFSEETAASLGVARPSRAVMWGVSTTMVDFLARAVLGDAAIRVSGPGSIRPEFVDGVLPIVEVKRLFGEFSFRETGTDRIETDDDWYEANIATVVLPRLGQFRCHRDVLPFIRGALAELEFRGLANEIDQADFQLAGGCYNARLARGGDLDRGFAVSRHSWGIAIDFNPSSNRFGDPPSLSEEFGQVMRDWGFAWGAGWGVSDPMHFEWRSLPGERNRIACVEYEAGTDGGQIDLLRMACTR